jgi:ABC-2 type transport system ATP-binding protein
VNHLALNVHNIRKSFASEEPWLKRLRQRNGKILAVNNITFQVERGEIYGILGPNGSGKSTLIRCLATLLIPDAGQVEIFGHNVQSEEMLVKRLINRVSVDAAFFKKLSAMENLMYAARLYNMDGPTARQRIKEILDRLGIKELHQPLEHMSRGMQQKVAIARAFLSSPILLLLDEPTTGLDPRSKREVQEFVFEVREHHDATVLLTTHDMDEADKLCDRVAIIDNGTIIAEDTAQGLKNSIRDRVPNPTLEDVFMELTGKQLVTEEDLVKEVP